LESFYTREHYKKTLKENLPRLAIYPFLARSRNHKRYNQIFSHPDYTVGSGITPDRAIGLAGFTAGRDFHPALKTFYYLFTISLIIVLSVKFVK
jgi:hypothetical protein